MLRVSAGVDEGQDELCGANLALDGLPDTFADVEQDYLSVALARQSAPLLPDAGFTDDLVSGFIGAAMDGGGSSDPHRWPAAERRAAASRDSDIEDRLALVQDTLTDFEANVEAGLVATDCAIAESATVVSQLADGLRAFQTATAEELAGVRRAVQGLTAQVRVLVELLIRDSGPAAS